MRLRISDILILLALLLVSSGAAADAHREQVAVELTKPVHDESFVSSLQPGLLPVYFHKYFERDVRKLAKRDEKREGKTGAPILQINHQFGNSEVFASGVNRGVAVRMRGYLYFDQPGLFALQALSNDGIELFLAETLVLSDPKQHSDQLSPEALVKVTESGWYPLQIDYFQRKGTAALKLFWKPPGEDEFTVIPARVYGHR